MGKIIRYNVGKGDDGERVKSSVFIDNSTTTQGWGNSSDQQTTTRGETSINATLWGQPFHGNEDIEGSMQIYGDVRIEKYYDDEEDDESSEDVEDLDGEGNLYVGGEIECENKIKAKNIECSEKISSKDIENSNRISSKNIECSNNITADKDIYAKEHLYVNNPYNNNAKTDVMQMLYNYGQRFIAIESRLDTLESNVDVLEVTVSNLKSDMQKVKSDAITMNYRVQYLEDHQCQCGGEGISGDNSGELVERVQDLESAFDALSNSQDITDATVSNLNSDVVSLKSDMQKVKSDAITMNYRVQYLEAQLPENN